MSQPDQHVDLVGLATERPPRLEPVRLRVLVEEIRAALAPHLAAQAVSSTLDVPDELVIVADRVLLGRAILELSLHALAAMPKGGDLVVTSCSGPGGVELEIADSGPGLPEIVGWRGRESLSADTTACLGRAVAIADRVARMHGGDLTAANCPEGGAAITIRLPRRLQEAAA